MKDSTILWLIIGGFVLFYISQSRVVKPPVTTQPDFGPTGLVTSTNGYSAAMPAVRGAQ